MKIFYTGLTALLFTGASVGAMAQMGTEGNGTMGGGTTGGGASFESLDTDGDGVLNSEEARAAGIDEQSFSEVDQNGDGVISRDEYQGGAGQQ